MKKILVITMCIIGLVMSGCSVAQRTVALDTVNVVSKASVLKGQYEIVSQIIYRHQADFSQEELIEFTNIDMNAKVIYSKIQDVMDLENFDVTPMEVEYLYRASRMSYLSAKTIISMHEEDFSSLEMTQLRMFDIQLQEMDKMVTKLLENPETMDTRKTLMSIISVASLSLKVILPLLI